MYLGTWRRIFEIFLEQVNMCDLTVKFKVEYSKEELIFF